MTGETCFGSLQILILHELRIHLSSVSHCYSLKDFKRFCTVCLFFPLFFLLRICLFQATGRYEEAAEAYREELQSNVPSAEHRAFIAQQTLDCYLHLAGKTHRGRGLYSSYRSVLAGSFKNGPGSFLND